MAGRRKAFESTRNGCLGILMIPGIVLLILAWPVILFALFMVAAASLAYAKAQLGAWWRRKRIARKPQPEQEEKETSE